ncbi:MAG: hypothetical protein M3R55_13195 [Acidobacteriota bacterium]|nr:hypothetical protein [Acidobacteriota bacterium]
MNALFVTQGLNIRFQTALADALGPALPVEARGFYVSDSFFHDAYREERPLFGSEPHVAAEWEIIREAGRTPADVAYLQERERAYASGPLWDALVCDRRMMQGRWCKERQDYKPRFSHDMYLRILTAALRKIEALFDAVRPGVVFALVPVTFGEYLIWMVAQERGIPTLYLYPTKVQNYMCWMDSFFGQPEVLSTAYHDYRRGHRDEWIPKAEEYIRSVEGGPVRHEGMVAIPGTIKETEPGAESPLGAILRVASAEIRYRLGPARYDNHVTPPAATLVRQRFVMARRRAAVTRALGPRYLKRDDLARAPFAFYPLHAEPEVALSIQGKPYQNQIETMRNIARSLPAGMRLVTKEHPRSIGYHPPSYYEKLLEIPNVRIADAFIESRHVVAASSLVVNVWSFVGFEAILHRKPVVSLGTPPFTILPASMIRYVTDLNALHRECRAAIDEYSYDASAVAHYVAACMKQSFPLDFYATYLEKRGRFTTDAADDRTSAGFDAFITYTAARTREVYAARPPRSAAPAS